MHPRHFIQGGWTMELALHEAETRLAELVTAARARRTGCDYEGR